MGRGRVADVLWLLRTPKSRPPQYGKPLRGLYFVSKESRPFELGIGPVGEMLGGSRDVLEIPIVQCPRIPLLKKRYRNSPAPRT